MVQVIACTLSNRARQLTRVCMIFKIRCVLICIAIIVITRCLLISQSYLDRQCRVRFTPSNMDGYKVIGEILDSLWYFCGAFNHMNVRFSEFAYPMDINISTVLRRDKKHYTHKDGPLIYAEKYNMICSPINKCKGTTNDKEEPPEILFLVKSALKNVNNREAIRKTWANENIFSYIRVVFVLGSVPEFNYRIMKEYNVHNDILQGDFNDNYHNNVKKIIIGLNWAASFCQHAKYVILVDDDYYVATERMRHFLQMLQTNSYEQYLYMGYSVADRRPHRSSFLKWSVTFDQYPYDNFPPFVSAGSVILSNKFVHDANAIIPYTKPLFLDDVYVGILAHKLSTHTFHNSRMVSYKIAPQDKSFHNILTSHGYSCPDELYKAWQLTIQQ